MSYERTNAERCYCDEAAAEADGYQAKASCKANETAKR